VGLYRSFFFGEIPTTLEHEIELSYLETKAIKHQSQNILSNYKNYAPLTHEDRKGIKSRVLNSKERDYHYFDDSFASIFIPYPTTFDFERNLYTLNKEVNKSFFCSIKPL
jgi:hypothetical protein